MCVCVCVCVCACVYVYVHVCLCVGPRRNTACCRVLQCFSMGCSCLNNFLNLPIDDEYGMQFFWRFFLNMKCNWR